MISLSNNLALLIQYATYTKGSKGMDSAFGLPMQVTLIAYKFTNEYKQYLCCYDIVWMSVLPYDMNV